MSINIPIQRFKYSNTIIQHLNDFAYTHRHDKRAIFKECWSNFIAKHQYEFQNEHTRLQELGFQGDAYASMYKSVRFYYRKMQLESIEGINKNKNKTYMCFPLQFIQNVDDYIKNSISQKLQCITNNNFICNITAADTYSRYIENNTDIIHSYLTIMIKELIIKQSIISSDDISLKFKKMFKNRFYKIQEKLKNN